MKRFQVEHTQKSCKLCDNWVVLSTSAVVGGGAIKSYLHNGIG